MLQLHAGAALSAALRDVAVVVNETVSAEEVAAEIRAGGGECYASFGCSMSIAARASRTVPRVLRMPCRTRPRDRTLTDKEVDKAHKKIEDRLKHRLKAIISGPSPRVSREPWGLRKALNKLSD